MPVIGRVVPRRTRFFGILSGAIFFGGGSRNAFARKAGRRGPVRIGRETRTEQPGSTERKQELGESGSGGESVWASPQSGVSCGEGCLGWANAPSPSSFRRGFEQRQACDCYLCGYGPTAADTALLYNLKDCGCSANKSSNMVLKCFGRVHIALRCVRFAIFRISYLERARRVTAHL